MKPSSFAALFLTFAACTPLDPVGIRRVPEPQKVTPQTARAATQAGDWQLAASSWYELYLRDDEERTNAAVETARALCELREFKSAKSLLDGALKQHPNDPDLLEMQGNVLVRAGFRRAAEPFFERALDLDPSRLSVLLALARARLELNLEASAVPLLERRIALGGGDAETWLYLARAQRAAGNVARSLEAFDRAFELGESRPDRLVFAASLYFEAAEPDRAGLKPERVQSWLQRACELDPQNTRAFELSGRISEERGDLERALSCYTRAAESDPADRSALRRLTKLHVKRGEVELALPLVDRLIELEADAGRKTELQQWRGELAGQLPQKPL